eukprot:Platyproteum_vivax@DN4576_c0_g1_i1.p1
MGETTNSSKLSERLVPPTKPDNRVQPISNRTFESGSVSSSTNLNVPKVKHQLTSVDSWHTLFVRGSEQSILRPDGSFNVHRKWNWWAKNVLYATKDTFHWLLTRSWPVLILIVVLCYLSALFFYATVIYFLGDIKGGCVATATTWAEVYFFVVESWFAIGYGSPRYPACWFVNCMVTPIVLTGCCFNALAFGAVFNKFASSANSHHAIAFSDSLLVSSGHESSSTNISFRLLNATNNRLFRPEIAAYIVHQYSQSDFHAVKVEDLHLSMPLDFISLPLTVSMSSEDGAFNVIPGGIHTALNTQGVELLIVLSYTTENTSRVSEVRKSYDLQADVHSSGFWMPMVDHRLMKKDWVVDVNKLHCIGGDVSEQSTV